MRRIPILATLVVLLALGAMIGLGIWQIHRAQWKEGLLASYQAAEGLPVLHTMPDSAAVERNAFRRADILCTISTGVTQIGGASRAGESGFRNIFGCRLADGRMMMADIGWSGVMAKPALPGVGQRAAGVGRLIPDDVLARRVIGEGDRIMPVLVVFEQGSSGLQASVPPSIADIPNNHRSYAVQWFLFAAVAAIIFVLAVLRRPQPK
jgi:surfeit locus 1 family protein